MENDELENIKGKLGIDSDNHNNPEGLVKFEKGNNKKKGSVQVEETQDENGDEFGTQGLVTSVVTGERTGDSSELTNLIVSTARQDSVTWNRDDVSVVVITRRLGE